MNRHVNARFTRCLFASLFCCLGISSDKDPVRDEKRKFHRRRERGDREKECERESEREREEEEEEETAEKNRWKKRKTLPTN